MHMNQRRLFSAIALTAAFLASTSAWGQAKSNRPISINKIVAIVNDDVITQQEIDDRINILTKRAVAQGSAVPSRAELQKQVLERLISDRVQLQLAKENGMKVDDITLDRTLARMAEDNKMTLQVFRNQIERDGTPYASFREDIRDEIALQRIHEREVLARIQISELEVDNYLAEQAAATATLQEVNLAHILIMIPENANAEQIKARFARVQEVEKRVRAGEDFGKLALTYSDAAEGSKGGELGWRDQTKLPPAFVDAISKLKNGETTQIIRSPNGFHLLKLIDKRTTNKAKESNAVLQSHVRHILLRITPTLTAADARKKLADIKKRIDSKTSTFEEEAKANSVDLSASKGGDLGWIYPGDTVPQFEEAFGKLALNEVSDPVESPFGYHLIQVLERKSEDVSQDRQRNAARLALRERKADEALQDWIRELRDRAFIEYRTDSK